MTPSGCSEAMWFPDNIIVLHPLPVSFHASHENSVKLIISGLLAI